MRPLQLAALPELSLQRLLPLIGKEKIDLIHSMTGYGRAVRTVNGREITVELRAVNNRFLDCTVRMPRLFSYAEDAVRQTVKENVARGKVDVFVTVNVPADGDVRVTLNRPVLEGYLEALRTMVREYDVQDTISTSSLSRFPDVFVVERKEEDEAQNTADIVSVAAEAVEAFNAMRSREGAAMEADLRAHAEIILRYVGQIEERSPVTLREYRERLEAKMREVLDKTGIDEARILTEAALFADKIAVDEETVRLRSHFEQFDALLTTGGPIGRKLDFLMQEMNREANTIGSKANDLQQARSVVEIKAELEKLREQIQNIE